MNRFCFSFFSLCTAALLTTLYAEKEAAPPVNPVVLSAEGQDSAASPKMTHPEYQFEMVAISAGTFTMGSPPTEKGRGRDENAVEVTLTEPFFIGTTEVTQGLWTAVMGVSVMELIASKADPLGRGANLKNEPSALGPEQPMCFVSYTDALEFCQALTASDREKGHIPAESYYTLPTEAQWEYAARAGTQSVFSFGDTLTSQQANFYGVLPYGVEEPGIYLEQTSPVKTYQANPWGLYDVHGNVYEWCLDWYTEELPGGKDPAEMGEGDSRNMRGGAWNRKATSCRSAYRYSYDPTQRTNNIGFRVILKGK